MNVREQTEKIEKDTLSPFAVLSHNSKGRARAEDLCDLRTCFQRDRDRIIHSKAFRRLKHKTQVFLSPEGDHYRTRLTHTLEVAQIARTIARALRLNEDLTEAIALGHDLGHTPFGHAGERALRDVCTNGFDHNLQSVRVAEKLEKDRNGLNLTAEVLDGIANHTWDGKPTFLEGQIVRFADVIAYINHDIDDAIRGHILTLNDIPTYLVDVLGKNHSERISTMIRSVIDESNGKNIITMQDEILEATLALKKFMFDNVYYNPTAKGEEGKAIDLVMQLYNYFMNNQDKLPEEYLECIMTEGAERAVIDYIAGMSDRYAVSVFTNLFVPNAWQYV